MLNKPPRKTMLPSISPYGTFASLQFSLTSLRTGVIGFAVASYVVSTFNCIMSLSLIFETNMVLCIRCFSLKVVHGLSNMPVPQLFRGVGIFLHPRFMTSSSILQRGHKFYLRIMPPHFLSGIAGGHSSFGAGTLHYAKSPAMDFHPHLFLRYLHIISLLGNQI